MLKYLSILLLSQCSFANEYYFPCDDNINKEECSIITDGYCAIKSKTIAGNGNEVLIKDINLQNIAISVMGEEQGIGSLVIKNYSVTKCDICKDKEPSVALTLKFILQRRISKQYLSLIQRNKITDLQEFNKNGYLLVFDIVNDDRYVIFFRDMKNKIRVAFGTINEVFIQPICKYSINLHFDSNDNFIVSVPKYTTNIDKIIPQEAEKNRIHMRTKNCRISYYHKYYADEIYEKIQSLLKT